MLTKYVKNFLAIILGAIVSGCASNNVMTLLDASKQNAPVIPSASVVQAELKGRVFVLGNIYFDERHPEATKTPGIPDNAYIALLQDQLLKAFPAAGLDQGTAPACIVNVAIEQLRFTQGKFMIPDPSVLRVRMEIIGANNSVIMRGQLESRYLTAILVILPGIVGAIPTGREGQEYVAIAKMIPAVAVVITRITQGLQQGKTLDAIDVYPDPLLAGGVISPDRFLQGKPYGLSEMQAGELARIIKASTP